MSGSCGGASFFGRSSGLWPRTRRAALAKLEGVGVWRVDKAVVGSPPRPWPPSFWFPVPPPNPPPTQYPPHLHLDVYVGLHRQEINQPLLDEAQEEADVPVSHVGLDPQEVLDDGVVTLGPGEELLDV